VRSYLGERDTFGRPIVWVLDKPEGPGAAEVAAFAADLRAHVVDGRPVDVVELMARKHDLLDRIEAAKHRSQKLLEHSQIHSPDGFEWGYAGNGPADLAHAILTNYLGTQPPDLIRFEFRDQIVTGLQRDRFLLRADQIDMWIQANQRLFRELWAADKNGQAWSVAEPATADGLGETGLTVDPATASTLVAALEGAWRDIQTHHPELPDAVMVLGTGVERGRLVKLGHWWGGQWVADGQPRGEVLLAGEALHLEPSQVFEVLLHEAAHGINAARGVKDTSRGGRYHNKEFAKTAQQVLLRVRSMPPYGLAATSLTPDALERYGATIDRLGDTMRIARQLRQGLQVGTDSGEIEGEGKTGGKGSEQGQPKSGATAASCGCGRKMRMAPSTLAAGPVVCGLCGSEFTNGAEKTSNQSERGDLGARVTGGGAVAEAVVDRSFLARRQASLAADIDQPQAGASDRTLERRLERLENALVGAPGPDGDQRHRQERRNRLEGLLQTELGDTLAGPSDPARADRVEADHGALRHWYERYGTWDEEPIPADTPAEGARRERLARVLLKADGTLRGPTLTTAAGAELQAGDRVRPAADHEDLPAGTPGTIERVDPASGSVDIDFATWGRLRTTLNDALSTDLRHDYADPRTPDHELASPGIEL